MGILSTNMRYFLKLLKNVCLEIFIDMVDDAVSDLDIWMNGHLGNNCVCNLELIFFFNYG